MINKGASIYIKIIICFLLIFTLSNPTLNLQVGKGELLVLIDESISVKDLIGDPHKLLSPHLLELEEKSQPTLISFAGRTLIPGKNINPVLMDEETNIEQALRVALGLKPQGILLITDTLETKGDVSQLLPQFKKEKVPLFLYPLLGEFKETYIKQVDIPAKIFKNRPFPIKVDIHSTIKTSGLLEIKLFSPSTSDFFTLNVHEVLLLEGRNSFTFQVKVGGDSSYLQFKVSLRETVDTWEQNNEFYVSSYLVDTYPLLLIKSREVKTSWVEEVWREQGFLVETRLPNRFPLTMEELLSYKGVVLVDVATSDLNTDQVKLLSRYLKEQGCGLITIGGNRSFGLGGYKGSALEEILPVTSEVKVPHRIPEVALAVVLDTSGSMSTEGRFGTKLDMARTGALRVLNVLSSDDLFAFIGFHSRPNVIFPFAHPTEKTVLEKELESLIAGGGTNIIAALEEGVKLFKDIEASNKQVLLISDGIAPEEGLEEVLKQFRELDVEIVAIGVGLDANLEFLRKITEPWGGKVYYSLDGEALPEIAAKEVGKLKASYVFLKPFVPTMVIPHLILKNIKEDILKKSPLSGYLRTTLKEGAQTILASPLGEPLVAIGEVGLGKSLVFTADGEGRLSGEFLSSPAFSLLLGGMAREIFLREQGEVEVEIKDNKGRVVFYKEPSLPLGTRLEMLIWRGDYYKPETYPLDRTGLDRFEGEIPTLSTGSYFLRVIGENDEFFTEATFIVPYPREYMVSAEDFTLPYFKKESNVTVLEQLEELKKITIPPRQVAYSLTPYFIGLSLFLFLMEVMVRRLGWKFKRWPSLAVRPPSKKELEKRRRFLDFLKKPWSE